MRDYVIAIACELWRDHNADIDEIAAVAGIKSAHVRCFERDLERIRFEIAWQARPSGDLLVSGAV